MEQETEALLKAIATLLVDVAESTANLLEDATRFQIPQVVGEYRAKARSIRETADSLTALVRTLDSNQLGGGQTL